MRRPPRRLLGGCLYLALLAAVALGNYECASHAPDLWGTPWPGRHEAVVADARTPWRARTGVLLLDRALHESVEAARFYGSLLGGSRRVTLAPTLDVREQG